MDSYLGAGVERAEPGCAVCGELATSLVRDVIEGEPAEDEYGTRWRTWKVLATIYFCSVHSRRSRAYYRHR